MRNWIDLFESEICSDALMTWAKNWAESSKNMQDKVSAFQHIVSEAMQWCEDDYTMLYRGFGITEEQAEQLKGGQDVTVLTHPLQSWTTNSQIATDYAEVAVDQGAGVLVKMTGLDAVFDFRKFCQDWIDNNRDEYEQSGHEIAGEAYGLSDAYREYEVVVRVPQPFILKPSDVLKIY